jgi:translation initiation factor IF-2
VTLAKISEGKRRMTPTTPTTKTPRLLEAAKEFNIGRETLVAFLGDKGFEITSNPSAKLTEKMYSALQVEFAQDKLAKRKSDEIALPKGSSLDGFRKAKDNVDIHGRDKKEEFPAAVEAKLKASEVKAKEPEKPKEAEKPKVAEAREEPKKIGITLAAVQLPVPVKKKEPEMAPVAPPVVEKPVAEAPAPPAKEPAKVAEAAATAEDIKAEPVAKAK